MADAAGEDKYRQAWAISSPVGRVFSAEFDEAKSGTTNRRYG